MTDTTTPALPRTTEVVFRAYVDICVTNGAVPAVLELLAGDMYDRADIFDEVVEHTEHTFALAGSPIVEALSDDIRRYGDRLEAMLREKISGELLTPEETTDLGKIEDANNDADHIWRNR